MIQDDFFRKPSKPCAPYMQKGPQFATFHVKLGARKCTLGLDPSDPDFSMQVEAMDILAAP